MSGLTSKYKSKSKTGRRLSQMEIDDKLIVNGDMEMGAGDDLKADVINEVTSGAGVTVDAGLIKDGRSNLGRQVQTLTASGAITIKSGLVILSHINTIIAATLAAPTPGDELFIVDYAASGTAAHTVTLPTGVTFDASGNDIATLDAPGEALHLIALTATRWLVLENIGSVALSGA